MLLVVLELLSRGYRVCLSTHSPHVLDVIWAMNTLRQERANPLKLLEIFDVEASPAMKKLATSVLAKKARVYYFDRATGRTRDISDLDPGAADAAEAGWFRRNLDGARGIAAKKIVRWGEGFPQSARRCAHQSRSCSTWPPSACARVADWACNRGRSWGRVRRS